MIQKISISLLAGLLLTIQGFTQPGSTAPDEWFLLDAKTDKVQGVSSEKAYKELLKGKKSETIIVAVIDSGVDAEHEDLKNVMWVNEDEIPNNGKDDDGNGYIDDIHGWNFIGGKDGKNVNQDTYEFVRIYRKLHAKYDGKTATSISKADKAEYAEYVKVKDELKKKQAEAQMQSMQMQGFYQAISSAVTKVKGHLGEDAKLDIETLEAVDAGEDEELAESLDMLLNIFRRGATEEDLKELEEGVKYFDTQVNYHFNPDFDPRNIVGDNYENSSERYYGNNDVKGPDSYHGTHVAGIIAADRTNNVGMRGIADNVRIMSIRTVPDGDERDKDVANAIRYAVDNGARIINMSFGKSYGWDKAVVDAAVKHAEKNDVLLVHAAGNSAENIDVVPNFPNDRYGGKKKTAKNWLEIGALSWEGGDNPIAVFSNYGKDNVDIFSPGVDLYSTTPENGYGASSGTSMAAPAAAGVAAMIMSYYPNLSACQVREIIMDSAIKGGQEVNCPGAERIQFSELCRTGGVINAYEAVKLAAKTKGKRKKKKTKSKAPRA